MRNGRFWPKVALQLKKVFCKVSLCEYCQRQSCKRFTGLTIRAKIVGGGCLLKVSFLVIKSEALVSVRANASHADKQ